ncbi:hypothetical protein SAMN05421858_3967 [Haladaptatus litoreus]|uniref:Helix-turn-helix domain-containing protein n=1 Tax=Haladaptatus litoreus TaxID=553468 RepID=A0A1N7E2N0_9EURY|nr:winged helix-turn-helix domain-containing protein [Haladaptatus litoreus]SIR82333.1 hypothetical protein SAMN05421858_3967 [Haladaptatus litoreus]
MDSVPVEATNERIRDAFQLLANETRLEILFALWNAPEWTATFTELKDAVGMRDSGQFQYHLNQLAGTFIRRTDDGYTHLASGIALYRAMLGSVAGTESIDSIPLDEFCPDCENRLRLTYENQVFFARCSACDETVLSSPFLPAGLDNRIDDERLWAFDRWTRRLVGNLRDGVCPWCASRVNHELSVEDSTESSAESEGGSNVRIVHTCNRCGGFLKTTVGENVIDHPAVISFFYDRGKDITSIPHWKLDFCTSDEGVELISEEPVEIRLTIREAGDELRLLFGDDCSVTEISRAEPRDSTHK